MANNLQPDIFSSLVSDIKTYTGKDPLAPWLKGIRRMKDSLPPKLLKEKLPRFLQRCAQTFESDRRYKNDLRYLRVWLQLMDYVDEPKALLRTMENNQIGVKRSLFYQAYALYYEKVKKFEEADNMYHLGVQNLAEPIDELQKSYEQFLRRYKNKKIQRGEGRNISARRIPVHPSDSKENNNSMEVQPPCSGLKESSGRKSLAVRSPSAMQIKDINQNRGARTQDPPGMPRGEDTVIVKFVDTAIVGKSEVEDACHHGLVEPTINMKEALNAINNMFKEPLETAVVRRRPRTSQSKVDPRPNGGFEVFVDDNLDAGVVSTNHKGLGISSQIDGVRNDQINQQPFIIFTEEEGSGDAGHTNHEDSRHTKVLVLEDDSILPSARANVLPIKNFSSDHSPRNSVGSSYRSRFREDTVVHRFVGSTTSEEPKVENVCHHGLVEPTINLKEAMDDINNMFGKPIDFVRARRTKKQGKTPHRRRDHSGGFSILPDDDTKMDRTKEGGVGLPIFSDDCTKTDSNKDYGGFTILCDDDLKPSNKTSNGEAVTHSGGDIVAKHGILPLKSSNKANERDFFEPTVCMKEAMDEINKMFGMPLDM